MYERPPSVVSSVGVVGEHMYGVKHSGGLLWGGGGGAFAVLMPFKLAGDATICGHDCKAAFIIIFSCCCLSCAVWSVFYRCKQRDVG